MFQCFRPLRYCVSKECCTRTAWPETMLKIIHQTIQFQMGTEIIRNNTLNELIYGEHLAISAAVNLMYFQMHTAHCFDVSFWSVVGVDVDVM